MGSAGIGADGFIHCNVYTKIREYKVSVTGNIRVKFRIEHSPGTGYTAYGRIYKNGAAVGVEHSTNVANYQYFYDDIAVVVGDLVQLYVYSSTLAIVYIIDFALCYNGPGLLYYA